MWVNCEDPQIRKLGKYIEFIVFIPLICYVINPESLYHFPCSNSILPQISPFDFCFHYSIMLMKAFDTA
jgi:hypothetical protein